MDRARFAHGGEVTHQVQRTCEADGKGIAVGHRQGKSGAGQKIARVTHFGKGGDTGTGAALDVDLRRHQGGTQLFKRAGAKHGGEKQPVGPERAADLRQCAGQVVDPMEGQIADDQVKAFGSEGQPFFIRGNRRAGVCGLCLRRHLGREVALYDLAGHTSRLTALCV